MLTEVDLLGRKYQNRDKNLVSREQILHSFCCPQMSLHSLSTADCGLWTKNLYTRSDKRFFFPELWLFLYKPSKVIKMESHLVTHLMNHLLYWKESGYTKSGWSLNTKHTSFTLKKKKKVWKRRTDLHHSLDSGCGHSGADFPSFLPSRFFYTCLPPAFKPPFNEFPLCVLFYFLCNFNYFLLSQWGVSVKLTTPSPRTSRN